MGRRLATLIEASARILPSLANMTMIHSFGKEQTQQESNEHSKTEERSKHSTGKADIRASGPLALAGLCKKL